MPSFEEDLQSGMASKKTVRKRPVAHDDTIVIDVDDSESPSPAKRSKARALRSENKLEDTDKLCEFPPGVSPNVTVTLQDYKTLEHDTFLNDIIIDFYLTWLYANILSADDRPTVYIFSSMFYKRMTTDPSTKSKTAPFEKDTTLTKAQKRHLRVKGWTKNVELFKKDLIIIPICEHSHWYLVLVIRPGLITHPVDSEERRVAGEPFFIVLDSMGDNKNTAVNTVRNYLDQEWQAKVGPNNRFIQ